MQKPGKSHSLTATKNPLEPLKVRAKIVGFRVARGREAHDHATRMSEKGKAG